ncbi:TPA: ATP-grasp domain-containing protein [Staphylococcus aureus]|nr:ATP-grasp domain-containing protein [Staphylococcus aureus]
MTFADYFVEITSKSCEILGLPCLNSQTAKICSNKLLVRKILKDKLDSCVNFWGISSEEELYKFKDDLPYPVIIKPVDSSASIEVKKCWNFSQLIEQYKMIKSRPINSRKQIRAREVIIEEYIDGKEVSIETLSYKGEHTIIGVVDKLVKGENEF